MSDYTKQAEQFLADTGTTFDIVFLYTGPYFDDDKEKRDVYQFTLKNARGIYSSKFGDSIRDTERRAFAANGHNAFDVEHNPVARKLGFKTKADILAARNAKPTAYDVLACLTKYDPGTFADFCGDCGYDVDSRKAEKIYFAVQEEYAAMRRLFTSAQLEQLQEIN